MTFLLRQLSESDVKRVVEIEKEAFPTLWPRTPFERDLNNRRINYLVAARFLSQAEIKAAKSTPSLKGSPSLLFRLSRRLFGKMAAPEMVLPPAKDTPLGYVGTWYLTDEAHITAIAVLEDWQGQGLGELLLVGAIETSMRRNSRMVTLEARVTNYKAISLYEKYGFKRTGTRKAYYSDNREDAAIMETESLYSPAYLGRFTQLKEAFFQRRGAMELSPGLVVK